MIHSNPLFRIFFLNYGLVEYIDKSTAVEQEPNPIRYTYLKNKEDCEYGKGYEHEEEFRISLSALGIGNYKMQHRSLEFPISIQFPFNFQQAFKEGVIREIIVCEKEVEEKLEQIGIHKKI